MSHFRSPKSADIGLAEKYPEVADTVDAEGRTHTGYGRRGHIDQKARVKHGQRCGAAADAVAAAQLEGFGVDVLT